MCVLQFHALVVVEGALPLWSRAQPMTWCMQDGVNSLLVSPYTPRGVALYLFSRDRRRAAMRVPLHMARFQGPASCPPRAANLGHADTRGIVRQHWSRLIELQLLHRWALLCCASHP